MSFIEPIFAWNVPLVALIFLKRSLVFPILLFSSISLHWSLRKAFLHLSRWWSRSTWTHLLLKELQNYNSLLNNCWQENVGSHLKKIPHIQGQRRSPSKMVGGAKSHLEWSPIPTRDARRVQTKLLCPRIQRPPQRLSQYCVWVSPVEVQFSSDLPQGQGLWVQQTWVWHKPSWRRSSLTPP